MFHINWVIEDKLAGSPFPSTDELSDVYNEGIRAILSLDHRSDNEALESMSIEHETIHIRDFTAPTLEQLERACDFIERNIKAERPVLVHCVVGQGRTGTVICAYLISKGWDYERALEEVRTHIPHAVEVAVQLEILQEYQKTRNG